MKFYILLSFVFINLHSWSQSNRWQQKINYKMNIDMDVKTNRYNGKQTITYTNNSPDELNKLFFHLYFNAFQPGSSMDVRSQELNKNRPNDWDSRVQDRISKLKPDEIGFQEIQSIKVNGVEQKFKYHETILEVNLTQKIKPNSTAIIDMVWKAQVPLQIRRCGRDNPNTGVRYSMSQWYPKLAEYDQDGWHPNPYVAREFYGVWGDFDVTINIDAEYKLAGTGVLTNAKEIGWGYDQAGSSLKKINGKIRKWNFVGKNIHDFVWAADPFYDHLVFNANKDVVLHVVYKNNPADWKKIWDNELTATQKNSFKTLEKFIEVQNEGWKKIGENVVTVFPFIEKTFGKYPYPQYSFIHGGDGGMEYPMATLIAGSSIGTAFHELMHSWYQMMIATDEAQYPWMDEGFTEFATNLIFQHLSLINASKTNPKAFAEADSIAQKKITNHHIRNYESYFKLAKSGFEEPLTTHADHYSTNYAYSSASYGKGCVFLEQLGYIIGADKRNKLLLEYYNNWRFKHPNTNDFINLAEKVSDIELDWYKEYFVNTTKKINYGFEDLETLENVTKIKLKRIGEIPMPIDVTVTKKDGTKEIYYIPLNLMYGNKSNETSWPTYKLQAWKWTHPTYQLEIPYKYSDLISIEIDESQRLADIDRTNNKIKFDN